MVKGRPVRSCTKTNIILYSTPRKKEAKPRNENSKKKQSITDYFQTVDIISEEGKALNSPPKRLTRRNKANLITKNCNLLKQEDSVNVKQDFRTSLVEEKASIMTLNGIKSPPTPHRITLCTENQEEITNNGKVEIKNFQKPTAAPKSRKKLNLNREENNVSGNNHKLTDYFPVRRSVRKTKTTVLEEKQRSLEKALRSNTEDGLKICYFNEKGRGIIADKHFKKGDFVVEYSGDLIDMSEAKKREEMYALDQNTGCYMYYFKHNNQQYCIDATPESKRLGRLVNHSRNGNLLTRTISVDGKPRLVLIAREDIQIGEEILYDYGDRSKESLKHHPWLAS